MLRTGHGKSHLVLVSCFVYIFVGCLLIYLLNFYFRFVLYNIFFYIFVVIEWLEFIRVYFYILFLIFLGELVGLVLLDGGILLSFSFLLITAYDISDCWLYDLFFVVINLLFEFIIFYSHLQQRPSHLNVVGSMF